MMAKKVCVFGAMSDFGTGVPGCAEAPAELLEQLKNEDVDFFVKDYSMAATYDRKTKTPNLVKNWGILHYILSSASATISEKLRDGNKIFMIGGDHGMAYASLSAISKHVGIDRLKVFWFDAHADINSPNTSITGNFHGMPVRFLIDAGFLLPENIVYFGLRSIDPEEKEYLREKDIKWYSSSEVKNPKTLKIILEKEIESRVFLNDHVHISFDLDFFDGDTITGVGTPEKDGPTFTDMSFLDAFTGKCGSVDFVEFAPKFDTYGRSLLQSTALSKKFIWLLKS